MRHLISVSDLSREDVERLLAAAERFAGAEESDSRLAGKRVLSLFFESSTRTSSSFELAAKRLGAEVTSLKAAGSSADKGESLKDTVLTLAQYDPDAIVVRHPQIGAPELVARYAGAAVVNAGDGKRSIRPRRCSTSSRCGSNSLRSMTFTSQSSVTSSTAASPARSSRLSASSARA